MTEPELRLEIFKYVFEHCYTMDADERLNYAQSVFLWVIDGGDP